MVNSIDTQSTQSTQSYTAAQNVQVQSKSGSTAFKSMLDTAVNTQDGQDTSVNGETAAGSASKKTNQKGSGDSSAADGAVSEAAESLQAQTAQAAQPQETFPKNVLSVQTQPIADGSAPQVQAASAAVQNTADTVQVKNGNPVLEAVKTAGTSTANEASPAAFAVPAKAEEQTATAVTPKLTELSTKSQLDNTSAANRNGKTAAQGSSVSAGSAQVQNTETVKGAGAAYGTNSSESSGSGQSSGENQALAGKQQSGASEETVKTEPQDLSASVRQAADLYTDGNVVVKVSDTSAKAHTSASRQVADSISANLTKGKQEFQIDLYPQSLGKVTVKLTSGNGILTAVITASNPKTQSLLASNSGDIKSILQASGGQQNVNVVTDTRQDAAAWHDESRNGNYSGSQNDGGQQQRQDGQDKRLNGLLSTENETSLSTADFLTMINSAASAAG